MANPKETISLHVDAEYTTGFMVRTTTKGLLGKKTLHVLSRKSGEWVPITAQQLREHDIPSECIFAVDDLPSEEPESSKSAPS